MNIEFFKEDNKKINDELFSACAEEWAKEIAKEGKKNKNKYTQIRKFYDEVLRLKTRLQEEEIDIADILPYLKMLNAKAVYAKGRKHVTEKFVEFLKVSLNQVKDKRSFDVFTTFFEAFMGYYRAYAPKD